MPQKSKKSVAGQRQSANCAEKRIVIDHPTENEIIGKGHYSLRVTTGDCEYVEISIDNARWQPCRNAAGHWWHDLLDLDQGKHVAYVRAHGDGVMWYAWREFTAC